MFTTEHEFTLPMGLVDDEGTLHRSGVMRLATAADEIVPLQDPRVQRNPAYLTVILLSRVVLRIGALETITPKTIESLFAADLAHLQELYNRVNCLDPTEPVVCPHCDEAYLLERDGLGGIRGYPLGRLNEEMAFLVYYTHWSHDDVTSLEHAERRRWVSQISAINERVNAAD